MPVAPLFMPIPTYMEHPTKSSKHIYRECIVLNLNSRFESLGMLYIKPQRGQGQAVPVRFLSVDYYLAKQRMDIKLHARRKQEGPSVLQSWNKVQACSPRNQTNTLQTLLHSRIPHIQFKGTIKWILNMGHSFS